MNVTATDHASPRDGLGLDEERLEAGRLLAGRYRVVRFVAAGGMGEVYQADDVLLGDGVALKLLRGDLLRKDGAQARFADEIRLARRVTHPNVCRVFDVGVEGARVFYTMELHSGHTLARHLGEPMDLADIRPILAQMLAGLEAAHDAEIVHADLKPSNVLLTDRRAVITDFGLAMPMCATLGCGCAMPHLLGTPAYMAPEQVTGGMVTEGTDLFALGVILYEMVTGTLPWRAPTALATAQARLSGPTPSPRALRPDRPLQWDDLIRACLARDVAARPADARAVVRALDLHAVDRPTAREQLAYDRSG